MEGLKAYVISVTAAAMICGIVTGLFRDLPSKDLIRLFCGLVLSVSVLRPISGMDLAEFSEIFSTADIMGQEAACWGEEEAQAARADIIKAQSEAYILDKAADRNLALTAEVILTEDPYPVPKGVILRGSVSPYDRQQLSQTIQENLGIPKEDQRWTG